jgi:hypothetical protein
MTLEQIEAEINRHMPLDDFLGIQKRLAYLRTQEDEKLKALSELQQAYLAANTDQQRDMVKRTVGQIRELSRKTREEIRSLNSTLHQSMDLAKAKDLYEQYVREKDSTQRR